MSSNKKIKTKKSNTSSSNPQKVPSLKKKKKYIRRRKTKTRTKTKPHKYVSLREVELLESSISQDSKEIMKKDDQDNNHQLNLFPLHPQNLIEEKEDQDHQDNIMVDFFNNTYGGETLTSLLWGGGNNDNSTHDEKCSSNHQEDSYLSPTITYRHDGEGGESSDLMRSALRHREREKDGNEDHEEEKEEKWVSYEEVLVIENNKKKKKKESMEEEVMSGSRLFNSQDHKKQSMKGVLSLKLDYEEVMNAWSDKGSFYINGGGGGGDHFSSQFQIVPDILHLHDNVRGDSSGGSSLWRVPSSEEGSCSTAGMEAVDGASAGGDVHDEYGEGMTTMMKMVEREARVLRYKEKRQSRLFSKRIRYQVRKLNAEKRPRLKGRFVKRD